MRLKIAQHIFSEESNKDGVLTHKAEEYMRCLDVGKRRLEDLFLADSKYWADNLERTKVMARNLYNHMQTLL